jgi:hypothetical protein
MHGQSIAHMRDKKICIHNKHHSIYEMGSFSTNSNLSSELTRLQEHNLENLRKGYA